MQLKIFRHPCSTILSQPKTSRCISYPSFMLSNWYKWHFIFLIVCTFGLILHFLYQPLAHISIQGILWRVNTTGGTFTDRSVAQRQAQRERPKPSSPQNFNYMFNSKSLLFSPLAYPLLLYFLPAFYLLLRQIYSPFIFNREKGHRMSPTAYFWPFSVSYWPLLIPDNSLIFS